MVWYYDILKELEQFYKVYQKENEYVGLQLGKYKKFLVILENL